MWVDTHKPSISQHNPLFDASSGTRSRVQTPDAQRLQPHPKHTRASDPPHLSEGIPNKKTREQIHRQSRRLLVSLGKRGSCHSLPKPRRKTRLHRIQSTKRSHTRMVKNTLHALLEQSINASSWPTTQPTKLKHNLYLYSPFSSWQRAHIDLQCFCPFVTSPLSLLPSHQKMCCSPAAN